MGASWPTGIGQKLVVRQMYISDDGLSGRPFPDEFASGFAMNLLPVAH
jgi:hypothetical protein